MLRHESKREKAETEAMLDELKALKEELALLMGRKESWNWIRSNFRNYGAVAIAEKIKELRNDK